MKFGKHLLLLAVLAIVGLTSASAHGTRTRVGVYVGGPVLWSAGWGPYWAPPAYSYPPQVVVVPPAAPPVYIEQSPPVEEAAQPYWYYCKGSKSYYPYVKECPEGWQRVLPQPEK